MRFEAAILERLGGSFERTELEIDVRRAVRRDRLLRTDSELDQFREEEGCRDQELKP